MQSIQPYREEPPFSCGIPVDGMYDSESRGARLLDRFRLNLHQQRLILVASGQSLEFDVIREAAQIQFPRSPSNPSGDVLEGRNRQPRQQHPSNYGGKGGGKPQNSSISGKQAICCDSQRYVVFKANHPHTMQSLNEILGDNSVSDRAVFLALRDAVELGLHSVHLRRYDGIFVRQHVVLSLRAMTRFYSVILILLTEVTCFLVTSGSRHSERKCFFFGNYWKYYVGWKFHWKKTSCH